MNSGNRNIFDSAGGFYVKKRPYYINPIGLVTGSAAETGVSSGKMVRLAGGVSAFSQIELISFTTGGQFENTICSSVRNNLDLSKLTEARGAFAGIALSKPIIIGIVNVTPDSFYDGGKFFDKSAAIERVQFLSEAGADIVDIGGESTRPGAIAISTQEEIRRILPVIDAAVSMGVPVSVDTRKAKVMRESIAAGANIINDITGFSHDEQALGLIADSNVSIILSHIQGTPETMQLGPLYRLASTDIFDWLWRRVDICIAAGISRSRIAIDPGIGFGKLRGHNIEILDRAAMLHGIGCTVAIGVSRKSFMDSFVGGKSPKNRLPGTIMATAMALDRGIQIHRVHDVLAMRQAIEMWSA